MADPMAGPMTGPMADTSDAFSAESRLIHAGTDRTPGLPATPPLAPTSVYVSAGPPRPGRAYGRDGNPGWEALEQALGGLEDGEAVAFASGQAASMALMLALAPGRERIVMPNDGYYGGRVLADRLRPHGAVPVPVDLQDLAAVERELTVAPSVLWAETPTNPLLRVADLARLGALAAAAGAPMVVDNTVATGLLQRPLEAGATASPATSFGGVESTWERRARWPGETAPAALIRMSVGVEPAADLITDLDHALGVLLCDVLAETTRSTTTRPGSTPLPPCRS